MGVIDKPTIEPEVSQEQVAPYVEKSKAEQTIDDIQRESSLDDPEATQLAKFLTVDTTNSDYMNKMRAMTDWARSQGCKSFADIAMKVRDVEVKLGSPNFGEKRIPRIYNYIRLLQQQAEVMKEIKASER